MKDKQDSIYYVTADNWEAARSSPQLEIFRKKGIEVLLLADRVDEWMLSFLHEFDGKPLASVAKGGLDLDAFADEAEKAEQEKTAQDAEDLIGRLKAALGDRVKDVRPTFRLTDSPACLVADANEMSAHLQRLLKSAGQKVPGADSKPILEINPKHALIERLRDETDSARLADWAQLLLEQSQLAEGAQLDDPAAFVRRLNRMLLGASE
jgi:molecular chaperone HtpG